MALWRVEATSSYYYQAEIEADTWEEARELAAASNTLNVNWDETGDDWTVDSVVRLDDAPTPGPAREEG